MMRKINNGLVGRMWVAVPWEQDLVDIGIVTASPTRGSTTSPSRPFASQPQSDSHGSSKTAKFSFAQLPLRKRAFRVMLGLFISYKDVIRQISSADTRGCVFNGCVLPRLVISSSRGSEITHCTRGPASVT